MRWHSTTLVAVPATKGVEETRAKGNAEGRGYLRDKQSGPEGAKDLGHFRA